jgi:hypothetical protein
MPVPTPTATPPPAKMPDQGTVHVKAVRSADVKLEDVSRLIGDLKKGVGVAVTSHPPKSGIFGGA